MAKEVNYKKISSRQEINGKLKGSNEIKREMLCSMQVGKIMLGEKLTPLSNLASPANEAPSQYLSFTRFQL